MIPCGAHIPSVYCYWSKRTPCFRWVEYCCSCPRRSKRGFIEIMLASNTWNADSFGCTLEVRSIFSVSCACCIILHHNIYGNSSSQMLRPDMVWFLNVLIACSAVFNLWSYGVTNCTSIFSLSMYVFLLLLLQQCDRQCCNKSNKNIHGEWENRSTVCHSIWPQSKCRRTSDSNIQESHHIRPVHLRRWISINPIV